MKIKTALYCSLGLIAIFIYSGCYYDKESIVYPNANDCDTTDIKLSTDLNAIMSTSCYSCHSTANAPAFGGNYNLQDYTTIKNAALDGRLLSSITQDGVLAAPMPQSGTKLSDCSINKFRAWINAGVPNN